MMEVLHEHRRGILSRIKRCFSFIFAIQFLELGDNRGFSPLLAHPMVTPVKMIATWTCTHQIIIGRLVISLISGVFR